MRAVRLQASGAEAWRQRKLDILGSQRGSLDPPCSCRIRHLPRCAEYACLPRHASAHRGLSGLDIGCGEGANTRQACPARRPDDAIDMAPTFIRHAQATEDAEPLGIAYQVADGMSLPFPTGSFDFVTAFMSLMDMPDHGRRIAGSARVLRPGGFLQFSILHPCFIPPHRKRAARRGRAVRAIESRRLLRLCRRAIGEWCFRSLPTDERQHVAPFRDSDFHRTLSGWVDLISRGRTDHRKVRRAGPGPNKPPLSRSLQTPVSLRCSCTSAPANPQQGIRRARVLL